MVAATIDEYLAGVSDAKRDALARLRGQIRAAVPAAVEAMSYGMPAYRLKGRYFVGFGTTKDGCSFYVGRAPILALAEALAPYRVWKGTINFAPDQPLPVELVAQLLRLRVDEFEHAVGEE